MLIRQTLLYLPAQVLGPLVQLAAMVVWTHFLAPTEMGVLALIVATQELIYSATLFWFSLSTVRYHDHEGDADTHEKFLNTETATLFTASILASLAVLILPMVVGATWSLPLVAVTMVYTVTRGMVAHLSDRARAEHDTLSYSLMQICWPVLGLAAGLLFVWNVEASATWVLMGYVVAQIAALAIASGRMQFGLSALKYDRGVVAQAMRYGLPLVFGYILVWVAQNSLRFVVEWQQGAAAVGLVTVGWGLGLRVSAFASMLVTAAAFPLAVKRSREATIDEGQRQLQQNGILLLAALAPACAGLWLVSDTFVGLTVAEPFQKVTEAVLPWAILAGALRSLRLHFGEQVFLLRERTMVPLVNDFIDALLATVGTVIGLNLGGLEGAVMGGAAGAFTSAIVTLIWAWVSHSFTLPVWDSLKIGTATLLMAVGVWLLPSTVSITALVLSVGVGALIYAGALGTFYPEFRDAALKFWRKERTS